MEQNFIVSFHFTSFHFIKARLKGNNLNREYILFSCCPIKKHMGISKLCTLIQGISCASFFFFSFSLLQFRGTGSQVFFVGISKETGEFIIFSCFREDIQIIMPWVWWIWWNRVIFKIPLFLHENQFEKGLGFFPWTTYHISHVMETSDSVFNIMRLSEQ